MFTVKYRPYLCPFCQYFTYCDEICWAIEALKETGKPIVAMMNIGSYGDGNGISTGDCAVKMAEAGMT